MPSDLKRAGDSAHWPSIAETFKGRSLLITGGTGFMGKVLIEKLLYSCPDINKIYIVARAKRGKGEETRVAEIMKLPVSITIQKRVVYHIYYALFNV
jgi:fatty acyl-CoA reductase